MARACLLFVFKALLQFCGATQCESDQVANLQNIFKASKVEKEVAGRSCPPNQLNAGICPDGSCTGCTGGEVIPTTAIPGFPPGSLTCGEEACSLGDISRDFYEFKNPSDYLTCGSEAACNIFKVQNASAICCTGSGSCKESFFKLQPDPSCGGDVCCSESSCQESSFRSVRSMACLGNNACEKDTSVTLTGDLIVGAGVQAGGESTFTFINAGNHCVRTVGASVNALVQATLVVQQASNVRMLCDKTASCVEADVFLSARSCFHVTCGDFDDCQNFDVLPLDFQCFCTGDDGCDWTNDYPNTLYCYKTTTTDPDPCGNDICPGTSPVCLQSETASTAMDLFNCNLLANGPCATTSTSTPGGGVGGDPHLRTLDGRHYTLMQQGNFLLWAFSGYETEVLVQGTTKKVPVDFEIFTHYAGHASFTKGFLLVDKSQTVPRPALEVTTKDCRWHHYNMTAMVWRPVGPVAGHLKLVAIRCNQRQQPKTSEKDVRKSPEFCKIFDLTQETERFRWRSIWRFQPLGIQTWARKAQALDQRQRQRQDIGAALDQLPARSPTLREDQDVFTERSALRPWGAGTGTFELGYRFGGQP
ncbi:unnamed protein product [Cladocopium goreaui]|uniref:Autophagy-related protein 18a n=1 Tax=Cladocopium goreaui TaxID=2562237 RepID=A0A9P1GKT1_9DINO|nr:unnamed protein product [Cladocopium goreaui]